jgi:hypothetical protein
LTYLRTLPIHLELTQAVLEEQAKSVRQPVVQTRSVQSSPALQSESRRQTGRQVPETHLSLLRQPASEAQTGMQDCWKQREPGAQSPFSEHGGPGARTHATPAVGFGMNPSLQEQSAL